MPPPQVQLFAMWLIGVRHTDGAEQARAVGFFKMVQSLGWCVGFALVPTSRVPPTLQLGLTLSCCVAGCALACTVLPGSARWAPSSNGAGEGSRASPPTALNAALLANDDQARITPPHQGAQRAPAP